MNASLAELNQSYGSLTAREILELARRSFPGGELSFANSFGLEDLVIQHMLLQMEEPPESFVLDTGRLPEETYELIERWRLRFDLRVRHYSPDAAALEGFLTGHGPNAFYQSLALRKSCCAIRKVEPLGRALAGKKAWISGLRREQSETRAELEVFSHDAAGRLKISPLAHWSLAQVRAYIEQHDLPYNRLHDRGYPSLGCAPCTRAVAPGEDIRAGRWWWENALERECGLHSPQRPLSQERNSYVPSSN